MPRRPDSARLARRTPRPNPPAWTKLAWTKLGGSKTDYLMHNDVVWGEVHSTRNNPSSYTARREHVVLNDNYPTRREAKKALEKFYRERTYPNETMTFVP